MKTAFIFHGTGGHPQENWFPWMRDELEKLGYTVIVPQFPTPENQTLEGWFAIFERVKERYDGRSILIGHSLGGAFALRVLERYEVEIKAAAFVGTPVGVRPIKNFKGDYPFIGHPFDWELIRGRAGRFLVYHSDNDPYVSMGNGELLADELGTRLTYVPGAGHFNAVAGYTQFPQLLDALSHGE